MTVTDGTTVTGKYADNNSASCDPASMRRVTALAAKALEI